MHDILIKNGTMIDGTGAPMVPRDIAIDGGRIAAVYERHEGKAGMVIDASGKIVCPGFIDIHSHSELHLLGNPLAESKIRQGVTTELVGNCGGSPAPAIGDAREGLKEVAAMLNVKLDWATMDEYLLRLVHIRPSVNVATLVGATSIRQSVIGGADRKPSGEELERMNSLLADSMLEGAYGLSSGLIYAPGCYASTEELISLASTAASFGGMYASHIRGEGRTLIRAVEEAIRIGREARIRVEISHHKACGRSSWGSVQKTLELIEGARAARVDVGFDVYPYTASSTSLDTILPPWAREGSKADVLARLKDPEARRKMTDEFSKATDDWEDIVAETGWENVMVMGFREGKNREFENKSIAQIANELHKDPAEVALDLLVEEDLHVWAIFHEISEEDVCRVISHPLAAIGSDGEAEAPYGPTGAFATHPRAYGAFPRSIRRYALDKGLVSLEQMIRKMTAMPAARIGLPDRGAIARGMAADVVIFDPERISDMATFENSHVYPDGIEMVIVNGAITVSNGEHTKERAGQVLRHTPSVA